MPTKIILNEFKLFCQMNDYGQIKRLKKFED